MAVRLVENSGEDKVIYFKGQVIADAGVVEGRTVESGSSKEEIVRKIRDRLTRTGTIRRGEGIALKGTFEETPERMPDCPLCGSELSKSGDCSWCTYRAPEDDI